MERTAITQHSNKRNQDQLQQKSTHVSLSLSGDATTTATDRSTKRCMACGDSKPRSDFYKKQWNDAQNGKCKCCVPGPYLHQIMKKAKIEHTTTTTTTTTSTGNVKFDNTITIKVKTDTEKCPSGDEIKRHVESNSNTIVKDTAQAAPKKTARKKAAPAKPSDLCCSQCKATKKVSHFSKDCMDVNGKDPVCTNCLFDAIPRSCKDCSQFKPKAAFCSWQWELPVCRVTEYRNCTTKKILELAAEAASSRMCLDCEKVRQEKKEQEEAQAEALKMEVFQKHNVQFYDFESLLTADDDSQLRLQYSKTPPTGGFIDNEYDVIYHSGFCQGEEIENRTTKGKVVFQQQEPKEKFTGTANFLEELRLTENFGFQRDIRFSEGKTTTDNHNKEWWCELQAVLTDEKEQECLFCGDMEFAEAVVRCIAKRTAMPWMKHEKPGMNKEEDDKVEFATLDEAEALATTHGDETTNGSSKPSPVFFLEPGDLHLSINWSNDHREQFTSDYVLRKQKV